MRGRRPPGKLQGAGVTARVAPWPGQDLGHEGEVQACVILSVAARAKNTLTRQKRQRHVE